MARSAKSKGLKDPDYLVWLHHLPCAACAQLQADANAMGVRVTVRQASRTEAAHVGDRGLSQKCSDREAIPLCGFEHHREGPSSVHKLGTKFWDVMRIDRDELIKALNDAYDTAVGLARA